MTARDACRDVEVSILCPVYNEESRVQRALEAVHQASLPFSWELIVVDDGSSDETWPRLRDFLSKRDDQIRVRRHERNLGKGHAIVTGLEAARGRFAVVYDADLEYDPADIPLLMEPLADGSADLVFGVRNLGQRSAHTLANRLLTFVTNRLFGGRLRDVMTGAKAFPVSRMRALELTSEGFEVEAEIAARCLLQDWRVREVPVQYRPRTRAEGKKIRAGDGIRVLAALVRTRCALQPR